MCSLNRKQHKDIFLKQLQRYFLGKKSVLFSFVDHIFFPLWFLITVFAPYRCASVSMSTTLCDNVVSAVLPLHRLTALLSGGWGGHKKEEKKSLAPPSC